MGRKAGSRNLGYFYRAGRGWYTKYRGRFVALIGDDGKPLKNKATPVATIKSDCDRIIAGPVAPVNSMTASEVFDASLVLSVVSIEMPSTHVGRASNSKSNASFGAFQPSGRISGALSV